MKKIASLFLISAMALSLAACAKPAEAPSTSASAAPASDTVSSTPEAPALSGKIIFATPRTDIADTLYREIADEFEAMHPGTEIEIEALKDPITVLKTRMAANELPDITPVTEFRKDNMSLYYAPLDDLGYNKDNLYFYEDGLGADGKHYYVISGVNHEVMIYNKAVLKECGVEKVPTTREEFYAACEAIKAKGYLPVATNFKELWTLQGFSKFMALATTGNGNYTNELADKDEILTDDNGFLNGINFLKEIADKGYAEPDLMSTNWDGFKRDMGANKVGFAFLSSGVASQIVDGGGKQEDLGVAPVPDSKGVVLHPDWAYGISKDSKNPELAKAFFAYLFTEGKYCVTNATPAYKSLESTNPFVAELMATNPTIIETTAQADQYSKVLAKAQFESYTVAQAYVLADNPDDVIKEYNEKWAQARKEVQ